MREGKDPVSTVFRFPESCLAVSTSPTRKFASILLGHASTKEPKEILILGFVDGAKEDERGSSNDPCIRIMGGFGIQKSSVFSSTMSNYEGLICLGEDIKDNPVLFVSAALEFTDALTQSGMPCLHIISCQGTSDSSLARIISVESDSPIMFVTISSNEDKLLLTSSGYSEDGLQSMKFDAYWQAFTWGNRWSLTDADKSKVEGSWITGLCATDSCVTYRAVDSNTSRILVKWKKEGNNVGQVEKEQGAANIFQDNASKYWFEEHRNSSDDFAALDRFIDQVRALIITLCMFLSIFNHLCSCRVRLDRFLHQTSTLLFYMYRVYLRCGIWSLK